MTQQRKDAETRKKELKLAIFRIEQGRARTKVTNLSIAAVAREAGVTPALIHNHYPSIAEDIRVKLGASSRQQRDVKQTELSKEQMKSKELRKELKDMGGRMAKLVSINEMLLLENRVLNAKESSSKVVIVPFKI